MLKYIFCTFKEEWQSGNALLSLTNRGLKCKQQMQKQQTGSDGSPLSYYTEIEICDVKDSPNAKQNETQAFTALRKCDMR